MAVSELKLIKRCAERLKTKQITYVPSHTRGIYTLLKYRPKQNVYDVVYIGMAGGSTKGGIAGRLRAHRRNKQKAKAWDRFSVFEVWDNIREEEIRELEGIFRHIYRLDSRANSMNKQREFKKLQKIRDDNLKNWKK
jgi:hypothetical protein